MFLLNEHPQVAIGFERFKRIRAHLDPFHFAPERFFSPLAVETDIRGELLYERLRARWDSGQVRVVGDKVPLYTRVLPQLLERFAAGRVVVLVRDPVAVAASFRRRAADPGDWWPAENDHRLALQMWNEALASAREAELCGDGSRVFLLPYEPLMAGDERWLVALMAFVGLPASGRLSAEHRALAASWRERTNGREPDVDQIAYAEDHCDPELSAWAHKRMAGQLEQMQLSGLNGPEPRSSGNGHEIAMSQAEPLPAGESAWREREREQLLGEMRSPGHRGEDELEVLERRIVEQAGELARRGQRLRGLAGAGRPGDHRPSGRVTFVLPHQRQTTGGVYVIEQLARHLSSRVKTSILVRGDGPLRPIPGVEVCSAPRLDFDALPSAEAVVYPADMGDAGLFSEMPARAGRAVMFFQGYGTPGSPTVAANLQAAESCVAIAHWLVEDARLKGVPCVYVPQGLDRSVFSPGPRPSRRRPVVSLMTHRLDWKGLEDAIAAISLVRSACADVEVTLFGSERVEGTGSFLASPSRPEVAALLRSSAVHVVASWEEGFGLTGAEAIACGAALATTDTKGSRDYALHNRTALVSPPREPEALARNIVRLLDDADLRDRLVSAGQRHLHAVMPPWPEVARRMASALMEL